MRKSIQASAPLADVREAASAALITVADEPSILAYLSFLIATRRIELSTTLFFLRSIAFDPRKAPRQRGAPREWLRRAMALTAGGQTAGSRPFGSDENIAAVGIIPACAGVVPRSG